MPIVDDIRTRLAACSIPCAYKRDVAALLAEVDRLVADAARLDALKRHLEAAFVRPGQLIGSVVISKIRSLDNHIAIDGYGIKPSLRAALDDLIERQKDKNS